MKALLPLLILPFGLVACVSTPATPRAEKSKYLEFTGAGLSFKDLKGATPYSYMAMIKLRPGAPAPSYANVRFENPRNPSQPFVVKDQFNSGGSSIRVSTPQFREAPTEKMNKVTVTLYSDRSRTKKIDEVAQDFVVTVPSPEFLRKKGLGHLVD